MEQGKMIEALKHLRKSGLGLAEAKALLDAHLRSGQRVSQFGEAHAKHPTDDTGGHVFTPPREGGELRLQPPPPPTPSGLAPGEVRQSNAAALMIAILVAVLLAYYFLG